MIVVEGDDLEDIQVEFNESAQEKNRKRASKNSKKSKRSNDSEEEDEEEEEEEEGDYEVKQHSSKMNHNDEDKNSQTNQKQDDCLLS